MTKTNLLWLTFAIAGATACGDDIQLTPDATPPDTTAQPDAAPDAPPMFTPPTPFAIAISPAGPDQLQTATAGPAGTFYAAGFAGAAVTGPRNIIVVKLTAVGALDATFGGGDGIATTAVEFRGGSDEIDIATQPNGKIVVSATVANASDANDRDVAVLRLNADGTSDTTFGIAGVRVLDLNTANTSGTALVGLDSSRSLAIHTDGLIYVHAVQRGEGLAIGGGPRIDTDFAIARLTADGVLDLTYGGGDGKYLLDIQESNATAKGISVLADGTVIGNGYANSPGIGTVQPVLYKLTTAGVLDTAFASGGVFHESVLTLQTEIYNVVIHGGNLVTAGYGRNTGTANDWVSMRFDATTGARDAAWGGAPNGAVLIDPSGTMLGSNCRNAVALPGNKTMLIGSTGPSNMPAQDAVFAVLDANGRLDTAFGDGVHVYPLGANGNDQFWGGAISGGRTMIVGYKGGGATQTDAINDDSYAVVLALP